MKDLMSSLRMFSLMTIVTGLVYPIIVTWIGQAVFAKRAGGGLIERDGHVVGAALIAQKFESTKYFWPRPSAVDYNPIPSGGSNLGPTSQDLVKVVGDRRAKIGTNAPGDLLFASASGLDPHISPEAAEFQVDRIALARGLGREKVAKLVHDSVKGRQLGFLGEPTVNVLELNLALDKASK